MALSSPDYAVQLMQTHECKFWTVTDHTDKNVLGEMRNPAMPLDSSIELFRNTIAALSGEFVHVKIRKLSNEDRGKGAANIGNFNIQVQLPKQQTQVNSQQQMHPNSMGASPTGVSMADYLALHAQMTAVQIEKMRLEMQPKETVAEQVANGLVKNERLMNGIVGLVEKLAGLPPAPPANIRALNGSRPGPSVETNSQTTTADQANLSGDINRLATVLGTAGADVNEVMHYLANYLEAYPDQIPMVLGVITPQS